MAAPIVMAFYLAHRIWFRTSPVRTRDMDIDTGRRDFNLPILVSKKLPLLLDATVLSPRTGRPPIRRSWLDPLHCTLSLTALGTGCPRSRGEEAVATVEENLSVLVLSYDRVS